ncbi:MAG: glycyl-radical enzyme activating protein [Bacteroidales bacterium]
MRGIVFDTRSFSVHDGPGIRKAIFLKGCPLQCLWCHNPESQFFEDETVLNTQRVGEKSFTQTQTVGYETTVDELMQSIRADVPFFEESGGGVTLTGGEPLAQPEFSIELLKACTDEGIHTAIDTCGHVPAEVVKQSMPYTNVYLYDLKIADSRKHREFTGLGNMLIFENLRLLSSAGKNLIIRIPLVDGITDTTDNIDALKEIISGTKGVSRIDLLPYHSLAKHKFSKQGKEYGLAEMENYPRHKTQEIARSFAGLAPVVSVGG